MKTKRIHVRNLLAFSVAASFFFAGTLGHSQSAPAQVNKLDQGSYAAPENDTTRAELTQFNQFLDSHREIAEQLRKDPSLANNPEFVNNHPALKVYLQQNPAVRDQLKVNANAFMRQENNFDHRADTRDREATRPELVQFNQFLDSHREIADQLRRDPSLANNPDFVNNHPALKMYFQQNPGVRDQLRDNANAFMRQEDNFDRRADARDPDDRREVANFKDFLGNHPDIAQQLKDDPSRVNDRDYMENHSDFQEYLKAHPDVQDQLRKNPQGFVNSAQQFNQNGQNNGESYRAPTFDSKPKQ